MGIFLGIDLGTSAAKAAALGPDGALLSAPRVFAPVPLSDTEGSFRRVLQSCGLSPEELEGIAATGSRSDGIPERFCGHSVRRIGEFEAAAAGALALSGEKSGVVVSLGTGTAFLYADGTSVRPLPGSGVGGGTLCGLCANLIGTGRFEEICTLAARGDLKRVDLTVGSLTSALPPALDPDMTLSNFGRSGGNASRADLAAGAVNLVLQAVGTMAVLACRCCGCGTAIFTGSLTELPQTEPCFRLFQRLYGVRFLIPGDAAYATALGAALTALRQDADGRTV
ncbi:MAG: pantothenate kinase [Oscillibacter sp.]|jgi:type II pantothenate kinase|nr:pantothenate kinase [Oscillibacter sp.]